jgi:myo-inositol 2-dehydrogenase / D-chiro-inositol 1-dehydrogenase
MSLRAGMIGGGWITRVHAPAIDAAEGVDLVAACDIDLDRAEALTRPRGGRAYTSWEEMYEREELDVVWICTPPLHHRAPALAALEGGIHVYLEKPIARTVGDAEAIVAGAAAAPVTVCAVGYQWHATELLEDARRALEGQRAGMLIGRNFGPVSGRPWFMDRAQGGGQLLERGSHHIDLQRALAGDIAAVQATAASVRLAQAEGPRGNIEDAITLLLHFASGALGCVHTAWSRDGQPELYAADVLAADATIALELGPERFRISGLAGGRDVAAEYGEPMHRSIAGFLGAVRAGDPGAVYCTPADALETLRVALACERALESGTVVSVT